MQSEHAQVAKMIRQYCKKQGIQCRARSKSYSGGDSVHVHVYDQPPEVVADLRKYASQFQEGHFNGMEDIYEYSNRNTDLPQSKFVFVSNDYSDELEQAAWDAIRGRFSGTEDQPESYKDAMLQRNNQELVLRLLSGDMDATCAGFSPSADFWEARKQSQAA